MEQLYRKYYQLYGGEKLGSGSFGYVYRPAVPIKLAYNIQTSVSKVFDSKNEYEKELKFMFNARKFMSLDLKPFFISMIGYGEIDVEVFNAPHNAEIYNREWWGDTVGDYD